MTIERPELSPIDQLRKKAATLKNKYVRASEVFSGLETLGFTTKPGLRLDVDDPEQKVDNIVRVGLMKERLEEVAIPNFLDQLERVAGQIETAEAEEAVFEVRLERLAARRETVQRLVQKGTLDPGQLTVVDGEIERVRVQQRQAIVPVQPVEPEKPPAKAEGEQGETSFTRTRTSYKEANRFFGIILPDGQIAKIKGKIKALALEALITIGSPASSEKLCMAIYGEYNRRGSDRLSNLIKILRIDLEPYNYRIRQPVGSGERGQGIRANYYLEPVQEKKAALVQEVIPEEGTKRFDSHQRERFVLPNGRELVLGVLEKKIAEHFLATLAGGQPVTYAEMARLIYRRQMEEGYSLRSATKTVGVVALRVKQKLQEAGYRVKNLHPDNSNNPGEFILEEIKVPAKSVVGSQEGEEEEPEEEAVDLAPPTPPVVPVSAIRREGEEPIRIPVERTKEELRTPLENALLTYVVDWLTGHNDLYFDRLHQAIAPFNDPERIREFNGLMKFYPYSVRDLQVCFESALRKLANDAVFEEANNDWPDREFWKKVQDLHDIMHADSMDDLLRKIKRAIAKSERDFKALNRPRNGGEGLWITL